MNRVGSQCFTYGSDHKVLCSGDSTIVVIYGLSL
ncbi:hypothetical protein CPL00262_CDS0039 [Salmonella phage S147_CPL00262]|uniref:Uncharacterized protein n=1 Tax=Klebsiella phage Keithsmous TaxID=3098263 RepID=A0ABZ2EPD2_9CAUD